MPYSLPYYRDASQLPGPLPDQNEIEQATHTLPRKSEFHARLVVIRDKYVVKYGSHVTENEGYALLFVDERLDIAAPRLHAMYRDQDALYIVMEYIPGVSLGTAWPSPTERCHRPGFYGGVNRGPVPHRYFYSREDNPAVTGPFRTAEEFARAITLRLKEMWSQSNHHSFLSDYLGRNLPSALCNYPPMFTHGDLYRENVLVRKVVDSDGNEEVYEVAALVDWETAGRYPSYWEYAHIFPLLQWVDDWPEYVEKVLHPLPLEGAMMRLVFNDLEF
ncbi:phosphotransferase enzyme family protein [Aspergillus avenaceus]|uniref:Phosphotransferase enzyme family protein n=1 Tax=Aspergillus avenaceus TaxID=36643 RepID=A0A5N6TKI0_ASPAV|nr:phosphotransferase enzyme family protein [Aspergillus avenaceus]